MMNETKSVKTVKAEGQRSLLRRGAIPDDSEAVNKSEEVERSSMRSCLLNTIMLKHESVLRKKPRSEDVNERIWMSLVSVFDQTFFKSLMRGANPCGGNSALELIPSGEGEVFAQKL